jgi:hypothetical protein
MSCKLRNFTFAVTRWLLPATWSVALACAFPLAGFAAQGTTVSPLDATAIDAALTATAVPKIGTSAKQAFPKLLVADVSLAVCDGTPKTVCLDSALKTLSVVIARSAPGSWSTDLVDAVKSRNAVRQSIGRLQLSTATIVSAETTSSTREGSAVVRTSLPGYDADRAVVILQLSYGASRIWAVLLQRNGDAWRVLDQHQLGQS